MGAVKIKVSRKKPTFEPIELNIIMTIDSKEELDSIKREFSEGTLIDFPTEYSELVYDLVCMIRRDIKNL